MSAMREQLMALGFKPTMSIPQLNASPCTVSLYVRDIDEVSAKGAAILYRNKRPNFDRQGKRLYPEYKPYKIANKLLGNSIRIREPSVMLMSMRPEAAALLC